MCGIVGVAGALLTKDEGLMKRLLLIDYLRGMDATGFAAYRNTGEVHIAKGAVDPITLFDFGQFKTALNGNASLVFLGHNRATTRGKNCKNNSHPFQYDHIVGVHNGTLDLVSHSAIEKELGEKFDVDSQAIFAAIAQLGVKKALSLCRGAWSLVWVDQKEKTLNFLRNKERPLSFAYNEDFSRLFWASESRFIDFAIDFPGYGEKLWRDKEGYCFFDTLIDQHYKFNIDDLKKKEYVKPTLSEVKGKEGFFSTEDKEKKDPFKREQEDWEESYGQYSMYPHGMGSGMAAIMATSEELRRRAANTARSQGTTGDKGKTSTTLSPRGSKKRQGLHQQPEVLTGSNDNPYAGRLDKEEFEQIAGAGCSICCAPIPYGTQGITIYMRDSKILCPKHSLKGPENTTRIFVMAR